MKKLILWGSIAVALAAALWLVDWRVVRLALTRDRHCSMADARRGVAEFQERWDRIGDISDQMKVVQTDPRGFELVTVEDRQWWIPPKNRLAAAEVLAEEDEAVYRGKRGGVKAGDTVLDCGANIGAFTRRALDAGARVVVAIEPAPENVQCLRRNFPQEIAAGRVIVYPKGVWNKDDVLVLKVLPGQSGSGSVAMDRPGAAEELRVPLTTIDAMVQELRLERVDFIKMDIEGAEKNALEGARQTVARHRPRMAISLEHRRDDPEAIPALVSRLWPNLTSECGPCVWVKTAQVNRIAPEVLFVAPGR
jgi:FkbM family methyltransferase